MKKMLPFLLALFCVMMFSINSNMANTENAVVPVKSVTINESNVIVTIGGKEEQSTKQLTVTLKPDNASSQIGQWVSSNEDVAVVDENGRVRGIHTGSAIISYTIEDQGTNKRLTAKVNVKVNQAVSKISLNPESVSIPVNKTTGIQTVIEPIDATNKKVVWRSDDEKIASVNKNGQVTGKAIGKTQIRAEAMDQSDVFSVCTVNVVQPVKKIELDQKKISIPPNTTIKIQASIYPEDATNNSVKWSSSNTDIADIDNDGVITAKKKGTANITAEALDGSGTKGSATVKVVDYDLVFYTKEPQTVYYYFGSGNFRIKGSVKNGNVEIPEIDRKLSAFVIGGPSSCPVTVTPVRAGTDEITIKVGGKKYKYTAFVAEGFENNTASPVDTEKEFRNSLFGKTIKEMEKAAKDNYGGKYREYTPDEGIFMKFTSLNLRIGGHPVKEVMIKSSYVVNESNQIEKKRDNTLIYLISYEMDRSRREDEEAAQDLYDKLCKEYGPTEKEFKDSRSHIWTDNDIEIELRDGSDLYVYYKWKPGDENLKKVYDILAEKEDVGNLYKMLSDGL